MLIEHEGISPTVHGSAYIAPNAVLSGNVVVGEGCSVLFGAVLTAEAGGHVELDRRVVVMENAVVRGREGHPVTIGANSLVGPHAHVNGCAIDADAFIATGASIFPGARLGRRSEVRIGAVVHVNSKLADDAIVPIGWIALGDPARAYPPGAHEELWPLQRELDFPGTVYGIDRPGPGETIMPQVAERYSKLFARHRGDRIID